MFVIDLSLNGKPGDVAVFLGALFQSGQAIGEWPAIVADGAELRCRLMVPARDALDPIHDGPWVADARKEIRGLSAAFVGGDIESPDLCACAAPSARILMTTCVVSDPPLRCADCWGIVPLYRLPYPEGEKDHHKIQSWQSRWQAFDRLWIGSGAGEGFAYAQMAHPGSALSLEGRELARGLERRTGVPVYYFLFQYHGPDPVTCPACGSGWAWEDPVVSWIPHRCEPCRLVAPRGGEDEEVPDPGL
jgi:predicted  nucleic acid-binding Zn ribbon protein